MGGRLIDWLGSGNAADRPAAADMPARIVVDSTAFYFAQDTKILGVFDPSGTPSWFDIDMTALAAFTTESLQDMIAAFLVNGTGITLSYDDAGNHLTINCSITQYTDEMAQDTIAAIIAAGTHVGLTIAYDDAAGTLSFTNTITQYTNEMAMDAVAAMLAAGSHTGITVGYNDAGDAMSLTVTITQYTDEMAQDAIAAAIAAGTRSGIVITYNDSTNSFDFTVPPAFNSEDAQDAIAAAIAAGTDTGISITYNDAGDALSFRNTRFMVPFWFELPPTSSEVLARYIATDDFTIPANFSTSKGVVASPPGADYVITVAQQTNATGAFTTIGTITIHSDSTITFATSGGTSKSIVANDVLRFTAQASTDGAIQGGAFNIRGQ